MAARFRRWAAPVVILIAILLMVGLAVFAAGTPSSATSVTTINAASVRFTTGQAVTCHIGGRFTWRQVQSSYPRGLSRFNVTTNNCRDRIRAFIWCVYLGPRAAHINRTFTGNIVIFGVTQVNCRLFSIAPGWTLVYSRGGGIQYYGSGGPGWHEVTLAGG